MMPTVVWAPEVPPGPQWLIDFVAVGGLCHPSQCDRVLTYTPESRQAIVCEFLAQGTYAIAHHHLGSRVQPVISPAMEKDSLATQTTADSLSSIRAPFNVCASSIGMHVAIGSLLM